MPDERLAEHLQHPVRKGYAPAGAHSGAAGGAACGDLVKISLSVQGDLVTDAGFDAEGCGSAIAAASATVELVTGAKLLDAARIGSREIAAELGGLSVGKLHAADLASDALHRALGVATRFDASAKAAPGRTLVAMSGGVDSAVAALLTQRQGGDVVAVTLELWADPDNDAERSCCSASAVRSARAVAHDMGLPHFTLDLREEFRAGVIDPWLADHAAGLTPNPCVRCNGHVRLDAMLDFGHRLGAPVLATGHYAQVTDDGLLRAATDRAKDQSYMLARLDPATIARMRFPLGELEKPAVRALAQDAGISVAKKPDSQDLCFLAGTGRAAFLAKHGRIEDRPGDVLDLSGRTLGRHRGAHGYTVGQRRGVGVGGGSGDPLYVVRTDVGTNTVTVGPKAALDTNTIPLTDVVLHSDAARVTSARLRYRSRALPARLDGDALSLGEPFAGAAPGQLAVLLEDDVVVGYATISA